MKTVGIIFVVIAILDLIVGVAGISQGYDGTTYVSGAFMMGVVGAFLISRANKKKREEKEKSDWNK